LDHPLVQRAEKLGLKPFGSPTSSDQTRMNFPSLKIGPGSSARSHTADEFIYVQEIEDAIDRYVRLLDNLIL
jgi:acetylornithine deacetylase